MSAGNAARGPWRRAFTDILGARIAGRPTELHSDARAARRHALLEPPFDYFHAFCWLSDVGGGADRRHSLGV